MDQKSLRRLPLDHHLGCFGEFNTNDPVCRKLCALRLSCSIEQENNARLEILDDLVSVETIYTKLQ